jgi:hypothetical protein
MLAVVQDLDTDKKAFVNSIYMTLNFFTSVMIYPVVGAIADRAGFIPTFKVIAFLGFGASIVVLLTRQRLHQVTRSHETPDHQR